MSFSEFLKECAVHEKTQVTHVICASKDNVLAEYVQPPYTMDSLRLFFSMTKSVTSLAVGIASDLGLLELDDPIVKFFPDKLPLRPDKNLPKITVRHLLTMSSGIFENTYDALFPQSDWVKAFLAQEFPCRPGTFYRYSTHSSHMLSAVITAVSGLSLEDFLNQRLFYPMGIQEAQWELSPEGLTAGGMGLSLYPHSLVKLSQLLLNKGTYRGKRLISQEYLELATAQQIVKQDDADRPDHRFRGTDYGFQFHIGINGDYRMDGAFGQLCLICPGKDLSITVFSQRSDMETLLSLIYRYLLSPDCLWDRFIPPQEKAACRPALDVPCGRYLLEKNGLELISATFSKGQKGYCLTAVHKTYVNQIDFSLSDDTTGKAVFLKDLQSHLQTYICQAFWDEKILSLKLFFIETPYVAVYRFAFREQELQLDFSINTGFTLKDQLISGRQELIAEQ